MISFITREMIYTIVITFGLIIFDILSGLLSAMIRGEFQSHIMREGGLHKLMLVLAISFGIFLDYAMSVVDLGINVPVGRFICIYIIIMEICSIIENINKGFPNLIPKPVLKIFNTEKDKLVETEELDPKE